MANAEGYRLCFVNGAARTALGENVHIWFKAYLYNRGFVYWELARVLDPVHAQEVAVPAPVHAPAPAPAPALARLALATAAGS